MTNEKMIFDFFFFFINNKWQMTKWYFLFSCCFLSMTNDKWRMTNDNWLKKIYHSIFFFNDEWQMTNDKSCFFYFHSYLINDEWRMTKETLKETFSKETFWGRTKEQRNMKDLVKEKETFSSSPLNQGSLLKLQQRVSDLI